MQARAHQGSREPVPDGITQQRSREQSAAAADGDDAAGTKLIDTTMLNHPVFTRFVSKLPIVPLLLTLATSAAGAQRSRRDYDRDYRSSVDTTFSFDRRGQVSLTIGSGDIVVTAWDRDQIRVHATSESGGVRLDASSSRVSVELANGYGHGGDARFEVTVPIGVRILARAQSGDIAITGTQGEVDARSQSGDIKVEGAANRLDIGTLSGDIEAHGVIGDVQIKSVSGDIRVTDFKGDFEGESV